MSKAKYTPGPWIKSGDWLMGKHGEFASAHIARLTDICNEHDKKLILTAPSMYEALEDTLSELVEWKEYNVMQIESFTGAEAEMQRSKAKSIANKIQKLKAILQKATL